MVLASPLDPQPPDWAGLPPIAGLAVEGAGAGGIRCRTEAGPLTLESYGPDVFRLTLGTPRGPDYGILVAGPEPQETGVEAMADGVVLGTGDHALTLRHSPLRLQWRRRGDLLLESTTDAHFRRPHRLPPFARAGERWLAALALASGEPVFGLGEKWGPLDRRGQLVRSFVEDALGVNAELSYKNCPFAWSPRGWGVFVHTPASVTHAVGHPPWSQRSYVLAVEDHALDLFLIAGATPAAILERYTRLTGRPPVPPRWSLGVWHSKAFYRDADEVLDAARTLRERRIPGDVITFDGRAWQDTATRFTFAFDPARYPDPKAVIDALHARNFRICCWEYPLVSVHGPLFAELEAKGHLLGDPSNGRAWRHGWDPAPFGGVLTPLPESGLIDLTNPEAFADWRDRHEALFALGVDVIKSDFGEQVPAGCRAWNGDDGRRLHNVYPLLYNRCVFEATERAQGQGFVFARAGWAGSQRYPGHWGGDPQSDFEGLAASLRGALSWALSGGACYATDIGGFYGEPPDAELFVRWTQAAVFASHMRFHGIGPREPWMFGERTLAILRDWLALRYRLLPYLEACLGEAAASGLPVMRPMPLAFPDQPATWAFETQYMFGPDLLVAPILEAGGRVRLMLPEGRWHDLRGRGTYEGGRCLELRLPLERFPVVVRDGAAIPVGPAVQHTAAIASGHRIETVWRFGGSS